MPEKAFVAREFAEYFIAAWLSAAAFIVARLAHRYARDPVEPLDQEALRQWKARRRWWPVAEFGALPAMALLAAAMTWLSGGSLVVALLGGMVAGGVGLPFLVQAMRELVQKRIQDSGGDDA